MQIAHAITATFGPGDTDDTLRRFIDGLEAVNALRISWRFRFREQAGNSRDLLFADLADLVNFKLTWPHGSTLHPGSGNQGMAELTRAAG